MQSEVRQSVETIARSFRRKDQEERAKDFSQQTLRVIVQWQKALWEVMDTMAQRRGATIPPVITLAKRVYDEDIQAIADLFQVATPEEIQELNRLFNMYGLRMRDVFERELPITYNQGLEIAYERMDRYAGKQDRDRFGEVVATYPFSDTSPFYRAFSEKALDLVRDKVSVQMRDKTFRLLADAIVSGKNWSEMASELYNRVGTGLRGRKHWERIVRTEMAFAYEQSQLERYTDAGIQYVRRSLANSACPVCSGLKGIWKMSEAPKLIVHPNCRCSYIPFYRLPSGASVRDQSELTQNLAEAAGFA